MGKRNRTREWEMARERERTGTRERTRDRERTIKRERVKERTREMEKKTEREKERTRKRETIRLRGWSQGLVMVVIWLWCVVERGRAGEARRGTCIFASGSFFRVFLEFAHLHISRSNIIR